MSEENAGESGQMHFVFLCITCTSQALPNHNSVTNSKFLNYDAIIAS
jgi:hypothetical protein